MTVLRLSTFNAPRRRRRHTPAAVRHLARRSDVMALQEWGDRGRLLDDLEAFNHYDPDGARPPIAWRDSRARFLSAETVVLAEGRRVGRTPGFRSVLGDTLATTVRLQVDEALVLSVTNVHLPAHVERRGHVRDTPRGRMWTEAVGALAGHLESELLHADAAAALGDWNMRLSSRTAFDALDNLGAIRLRAQEPTRGLREIDGGFLVSRLNRRPRVLKADALHAEVLRAASDHLAARFVVRL